MENSLENLTKYILDSAKAEAQTLVETAVNNADSERVEVNRQYESMFKEQKELLEKNSGQRIKNAIIQHEAKLKKERTRYATELINMLFDEAEEKLYGMNFDSFFDFYRISIGSLTLSGDYEVILGDKTAIKIPDDMKQSLTVKEASFSIFISEKTIPEQGGFLLSKPPVEYSFLFSDLLSEIKEKEVPVLLKKLLD